MFYLLPHLPSGQPVGRKKCYVFLFPEPFPFQRQKMVQVIRKEFPGTGGISRFTGTQDGFGSVQKQNVLRHTSLHRCKLRGQSLPDRFHLPLQLPALGVVQGVEFDLLRAQNPSQRGDIFLLSARGIAHCAKKAVGSPDSPHNSSYLAHAALSLQGRQRCPQNKPVPVGSAVPDSGLPWSFPLPCNPVRIRS